MNPHHKKAVRNSPSEARNRLHPMVKYLSSVETKENSEGNMANRERSVKKKSRSKGYYSVTRGVMDGNLD
jgi:hypothetical protein